MDHQFFYADRQEEREFESNPATSLLHESDDVETKICLPLTATIHPKEDSGSEQENWYGLSLFSEVNENWDADEQKGIYSVVGNEQHSGLTNDQMKLERSPLYDLDRERPDHVTVETERAIPSIVCKCSSRGHSSTAITRFSKVRDSNFKTSAVDRRSLGGLSPQSQA
jgi:hypothetical protein